MTFQLPRLRLNEQTMTREDMTNSVSMHVHNDASQNTVSTRASNIDTSWFVDQFNYLKALPLDDYLTAAAYTLRSHSWIGPYQRTGFVNSSRHPRLVQDGHVSPLFPQMTRVIARLGPNATFASTTAMTRAWRTAFARSNKLNKTRYAAFKRLLASQSFSEAALREALEEYRVDLKRIIDAAPPIRQRMVVYRGTQGDSFQGHIGRWYRSPAFSSAAFAVHHAMVYSKDNGGLTAALQRITLLPGARVLLVAITNRWNKSGEYEIVLNEGAHYKFTGREQLRWVLYRETHRDSLATTPRLVRRRVTSIELRR